MATTFGISANPNPVNENAGSTTLTVTRSGGTGTQTVYVSTEQNVNGFSANNGDYATNVNNFPVTFGPTDTTKTITLGINDLGLPPGSKTFGLLVQNVNTSSLTTGFVASGNFTINDNDADAATYQISANPNPVNENAGSTTLTVTRSGGTGTQTVYVSTEQNVNGFSANNGDYATNVNNFPVTFGPTDTTKTITLGINDLGLTSGSKTFGLLVQNVNTSSLTTGVVASGNFTINDNDAAAGTYQISANPNPVNENAGSTTLTVTRSGGTGTQTVYVSTEQNVNGFSTNNRDYATNVNNFPVTFGPTDTTKTITLG